MINPEETLHSLVEGCESKYGIKVTEVEKRFTLCLLKHCAYMEREGKQHAEKGQPPLHASVFMRLFQSVIPGKDDVTRDLQHSYAAISHGYYMTGYNGCRS